MPASFSWRECCLKVFLESGAIVHSLVLAAGKQLEKVACVFSEPLEA